MNKSPRLYVDQDLNNNGVIELSTDQSHYLHNVMRKIIGDDVRIFNGRNGEYHGKITQSSKRLVTIGHLKQFRSQPINRHRIHLYAPIIKKDRMAFMIEKSVELGVTDIHPTISDHTQFGKINTDKTMRHIIEAAEQCERLDIPTLHKTQKLNDVIFNVQTYAAIERDDNAPIFDHSGKDDIGILIGPEGGWSADEIDSLNESPNITSVSLGSNILRAETATLFMLSHIDK